MSNKLKQLTDLMMFGMAEQYSTGMSNYFEKPNNHGRGIKRKYDSKNNNIEYYYDEHGNIRRRKLK